FDLEFARPFLDTLPFAGRLSGRTVATGPLTALALETDWSFHDSLVPGWPETRLRGKGEVNLKAADGIRFQPFAVEAASVDLRTVARLAPAVRLHGMLLATGSLAGPLKNAQFTGTLEQRDGDRPASRLTGAVRLDTRGAVLGIYSDATPDPARRPHGRQRRGTQRRGDCTARPVAVRGGRARLGRPAAAARRSPRVRGLAATGPTGARHHRLRLARLDAWCQWAAGPRFRR